jgi:hypothetical protein
VEELRQRIEEDTLLFDQAVVEHGLCRFNRDYDVLVDVTAAKPDGSGSHIAGRYRYRFTHCPFAETRTALPSSTWRESWDDVFTDHAAWEKAGNPPGFVTPAPRSWSSARPKSWMHLRGRDTEHGGAVLVTPAPST